MGARGGAVLRGKEPTAIRASLLSLPRLFILFILNTKALVPPPPLPAPPGSPRQRCAHQSGGRRSGPARAVARLRAARHAPARNEKQKPAQKIF